MNCNSKSLILACVGAVAIAGCDLPPKNLGNETEGPGTAGDDTDGDDTDGDDGDDTGGPCVDGDSKMEDCNTCTCLEGNWACTAIGCDDTDGPPTECEDGDTKMEDCNTCGCIDGNWACTEIGCDPDGAIAVCGDDAPRDELRIESVALEGDLLVLGVGHSGGCEDHVFGGCWDGAFAESDPVQVSAFLSHDSNGEICEAYFSVMVEVDLSPMRVEYQTGYQTESGEISIGLDGWPEAIIYAF